MTDRTATCREESETSQSRTVRSQVVRRWAAEWEWWAVQPSTTDALARLRRDHPCIDEFTTVDDVVDGCGRNRTVSARDADRRLVALVGAARDGDRVSNRIVLERVMPALIARAGRRAAGAGAASFPDLVGEYAAAAWAVVATYPVERRPSKIVVNIVMDAEGRLFGRRRAVERATLPHADVGWAQSPARLDGTSVFARHDPLIELLDLLAAAQRGGLPGPSVTLLSDLALGSGEDLIAARSGVSSRAVRGRRLAAITHLTEVLDLPAPPARARRRAA